MPVPQQASVGAVGCHTGFQVAAALGPRGTEWFPAMCASYRSARRWLASFGPVAAVGFELTGSYGAALARSLAERGCRVIEADQPHRCGGGKR